jgi:hypothetical protein
MSLLRGSDGGDPGRQFAAPLIPAMEFLPHYSDLAGGFSVGARQGPGFAAMDAAFADFGAAHDFLLSAPKFYESNVRSDLFPLSGGLDNVDGSPPISRASFLIRISTGPSAEDGSLPGFRVAFQTRAAAITTDIQDVTALPTGALSTVNPPDGRTIGVVSMTDLRALAFSGANRGWVDVSQVAGNFARTSLSLGASLGPTIGVLAWTNAPSGTSLLTASPGFDPEDVVASAELEVLDDASLTAVSPDGARREWLASAPQVATLLTEGVTLGVTALERAVGALAEPMLDAASAPHDVLYWVGVSSWVAAAALAAETVRRRFPQLQTSAPSLFGGSPDSLR